MKNSFLKIFIAFFLIGLLFNSCNKDQTNTSSQSKIKLFTYNNGLKTYVTMLEFDHWDDYNQMIDFLASEVNTSIYNFRISHYTSDENFYNYIIDSLGFDENNTLIDFENNLNFTNSMRKKFRIMENEWLDNDSLIERNNPKNIFPFSESEMTLLNEYGEVKIGEGILKVQADGFIFITDGDLETLAKFNNGDKSVITQENVESSYEYDEYGDCKKWKYETTPKYYENETKVAQCHLHYHCYMTYFRSNVEIYNYKKKSNGNWKRWSTNLSVDNVTSLYDSDCLFEDTRYEATESNVSSHNQNGCYDNTNMYWQYQVKNGLGVAGDFYYSNQFFSDALSW